MGLRCLKMTCLSKQENISQRLSNLDNIIKGIATFDKKILNTLVLLTQVTELLNELNIEINRELDKLDEVETCN